MCPLLEPCESLSVSTIIDVDHNKRILLDEDFGVIDGFVDEYCGLVEVVVTPLKVFDDTTCNTPPAPANAVLTARVILYSHMMLIVPASKVSVPLVVVIRTRSRVPESVVFPAPTMRNVFVFP